MTDFILVHGGMHGAWCWELLQAALTGMGHRAIAMDVPLDDTRADMAAIVRVVLEAAEGASPDAVLVGHSLGGMIIPHVAQRRAFAQMIFLCPMIAPCTAADAEANLALINPQFFPMMSQDAQGRSYLTPADATIAFYHDVPEPTLSWALSRISPAAPNIYAAPTLLPNLPAIPVRAIITDQDFMVRGLEAQQQDVRLRLGWEPIVLHGSHSPFLSRPDALARTLVDCAPCDRA